MNTDTFENAPHEHGNEPTPAYTAHLLVEQALNHKNPEVPDEIRNDPEFKRALGSELARLLWREQDDEAEEVVEDLKVSEDILHSDAVRSAVRHEVNMLLPKYPKSIEQIVRLMIIFGMSLDDIPEELREPIRKSGHVPEEYREAA